MGSDASLGPEWLSAAVTAQRLGRAGRLCLWLQSPSSARGFAAWGLRGFGGVRVVLGFSRARPGGPLMRRP